MRPADEPAVRALQGHLAFADPGLVSAAIDGPFLGRVAVGGGSAAREVASTGDPADVVGYAVALPGRETTLSELVVDPGHRRRGHGRRLVAAVADAAGAERLVVTTPASDAGARPFYEKLGFDVGSRLPGFYPDDDALRLVRRE